MKEKSPGDIWLEILRLHRPISFQIISIATSPLQLVSLVLLLSN